MSNCKQLNTYVDMCNLGSFEYKEAHNRTTKENSHERNWLLQPKRVCFGGKQRFCEVWP